MLSEALRRDFPLLNSGEELIYFDNACMSLRPQVVVDEITRYYTDMSACAGRSNHRLARAVTEAVDASRKKVQKFLGAKHVEEVVFVRNTSEGLNLVAHTLELSPGDVVMTSDKEHNSNLVPWLKLEKLKGIEHVVLKSLSDNTFDMEGFERQLEQHKPRLVSVVMTSNLDGVTFPIEEIVMRTHQVGALVMVDAAQAVPHKQINVSRLNVDFMVFSGHKTLGPSGMGVLYGKRELLEKMDGFMVGGDTVEYTTYTDFKLLPAPEKFEAGLQNYAGIMGMGVACDYLSAIGMRAISDHVKELNQLVTEGLASMKRVRIIGPEDARLRGGISSFYVDGVDPHEISLLLDKSYGILVRSGQHCVHSWFDDRGIPGSVRASMYLYNTREEAARFVAAVEKVLDIL